MDIKGNTKERVHYSVPAVTSKSGRQARVEDILWKEIERRRGDKSRACWVLVSDGEVRPDSSLLRGKGNGGTFAFSWRICDQSSPASLKRSEDVDFIH